MPIFISDVLFSNTMIYILCTLVILITLRRIDRREGLLSLGMTTELKGWSILAVICAHVGYVLVSDDRFLYPLSTFAGTGVDIFLFLSGYGLSMSMSKRPLSVGSFYKQRLLRLFLSFWIVLALIVFADATILGIQYSPTMLIQSVLAWFPRADVWADIDSPFWYMTWLLLFYLLFPIFWIKRRSYLTALILAFLASAVAFYDPLHLQTTWLHRLHTLAFPLGILIAWFATERSHIVQKLIQWKGSSWRYAITVVLLVLCWYIWNLDGNISSKYLIEHVYPWNWHVAIEQMKSLTLMALVIGICALQTWRSQVISLFGLYSYEIYLIHWPLLSRYDILFHHLPAWLALSIWLMILLALAYGLQALTNKIQR